jgi:hypothetical protein
VKRPEIEAELLQELELFIGPRIKVPWRSHGAKSDIPYMLSIYIYTIYII